MKSSEYKQKQMDSDNNRYRFNVAQNNTRIYYTMYSNQLIFIRIVTSYRDVNVLLGMNPFIFAMARINVNPVSTSLIPCSGVYRLVFESPMMGVEPSVV